MKDEHINWREHDGVVHVLEKNVEVDTVPMPDGPDYEWACRSWDSPCGIRLDLDEGTPVATTANVSGVICLGALDV